MIDQVITIYICTDDQYIRCKSYQDISWDDQVITIDTHVIIIDFQVIMYIEDQVIAFYG